MTELSSLAHAEHLIELNFDSDRFKTIFKEILTVFQTQNTKIENISNSLVDCVTNEEFRAYASKTDSSTHLLSDKIDQHTRDIQYLQNVQKTTESSLREAIEAATLTALNESKRYFQAEMSAKATPAISKTNSTTNLGNSNIVDFDSKINNIEARIAAIEADNNAMHKQITDQLQFDPDFITCRMTSAENALKTIEKQLETYPNVQSDLTNLCLVFPQTVSRLETKITTIADQLENLPRGTAINVPISSTPGSALRSAKEVFNESKSTPMSQVVNEALQSNKSLKKLEEIEDVKIDELKSNEITDLPDLDDIKFIPGKKIELPPDLPTLGDVPDTTKLGKTTTKTQMSEVKALPSVETSRIDGADGVVQIIENRTYTTEMQSSMRVVTELQWTKQMIAQHHDAIKQLQASLRTQHSNYETMNENIIRVNTTINNRISQLAQQALQVRQENDEMRRSLFDQMNGVKRKIAKVTSDNQRQQQLSTQSGPIQPVQTSTPKVQKNKLSRPVLPPLSMPYNETTYNEEEEEKSSSSSSKKEEKKDNKSQQPEPVPMPQVRVILPEKPVIRSRKQNFLIVDIQGESPQQPPPVIIKQPEKKEEKIIIHVQSTPNEKKHVEVKPKPSPKPNLTPSAAQLQQIEAEEYVPPEREKPKYDKPIQQIILKMAGSKRPRSAGGASNGSAAPIQAVGGGAMTEDLEAGIKVVARKAVSALVSQVKQSIKEEIEEIRKIGVSQNALIDKKVDREFVEKVFDKLRIMMNSFNEQLENMQCSFLNWVTRDELEIVLQQFAAKLNDDDSSVTTSKYTCLLCGHPKQHLAGMINKTKPTRASIK